MNIPKAIDLTKKVTALEDAIAALKDDNLPAEPKNKILKAIIDRVEFSSTPGEIQGETSVHLNVFLKL